MSISLVAALLGFIYAGRRGKLVYAIIGVVIVGGVYSTLTRSAWLGAGCAIGLIGLMYSPRWLRVLGLLRWSFLAASRSPVSGPVDPIEAGQESDRNRCPEIDRARPLLAVVAWEMFQDRPIVGHGYGHYFEHHQPYHNDRSYDLPLDQVRQYWRSTICSCRFWSTPEPWGYRCLSPGWRWHAESDGGSHAAKGPLGNPLLRHIAARCHDGLPCQRDVS